MLAEFCGLGKVAQSSLGLRTRLVKRMDEWMKW
jgi:hypothetical protein